MTPVPPGSRPELWIIAGPNGAGKTTLTQLEPISRILPQARFINPDDLALLQLQGLGYQGFHDAPAESLIQTFRQAADETLEQLDAAIQTCRAVGVETVLSTLKYQSVVQRVRRRRGFVGLVYVALSSWEIAAERVARRVEHGGHDVPSQKIRDRWRRSLANLPWFARHATAFWVFDNSRSGRDGPPILVAQGANGKLTSPPIITFPELATALSAIPLRSSGRR